MPMLGSNEKSVDDWLGGFPIDQKAFGEEVLRSRRKLEAELEASENRLEYKCTLRRISIFEEAVGRVDLGLVRKPAPQSVAVTDLVEVVKKLALDVENSSSKLESIQKELHVGFKSIQKEIHCEMEALKEGLPIMVTKLTTDLPVRIVLNKFMSCKLGICDLQSRSSKQDPSQHRGLLYGAFDNTCIVTGARRPIGSTTVGDGTQTFTLGHIVQRKVENSCELMSRFGLTYDDIHDESNLLCMTSEAQSRFDKCDFCFIPGDESGSKFDVLFFHGDREGYRDTVVMPDCASRKMLMIQAMDAHRKAKAKFDIERWRLDKRRDSASLFVWDWLNSVDPKGNDEGAAEAYSNLSIMDRQESSYHQHHDHNLSTPAQQYIGRNEHLGLRPSRGMSGHRQKASTRGR